MYVYTCIYNVYTCMSITVRTLCNFGGRQRRARETRDTEEGSETQETREMGDTRDTWGIWETEEMV